MTRENNGSWKGWVAFYALGVIACGGPTAGENLPGDETDLDPDPGVHTIGALAVQPDEGHVWFVHQGTDVEEGLHREYLAAVSPAGGWQNLVDVSDTTDRWAIFPGSARMLLLAQESDGERLALFDATSLAPIASNEVSGRQWQTPRASSTGQWIAAVDYAGAPAIDVIDGDTLEPVRLLSGEYGSAVMHVEWAHQKEWLLALHAATSEAEWGASRVLRYDLTGGIPTAPNIDIALPDLCSGYGSSMIAVSPDDRWAVFTLVDCPTQTDPLVVVDLLDGSHRISSLTGPVTFTPDSSTIVGYGSDGEGNPVLKLIDVATLEFETIPVPTGMTFEYFVTPEGNWVVCAPILAAEETSIVLYDAATGATTQLAGPSISFDEFVYRASAQQMFVVQSTWLYRLDLPAQTFAQFQVGVPARRINILPQADRLVVSEPEGGGVHFIDPVSGNITRTVTVPNPLAPEVPAPMTLRSVFHGL